VFELATVSLPAETDPAGDANGCADRFFKAFWKNEHAMWVIWALFVAW